MKKELTTIAIASAIITGMKSNVVHAEEIHCQGVSTKWVNDCQANGHPCAMHAKSNFDANEWLKMKKSDCKAVKSALTSEAVKNYITRIQKGTVTAVKRGKKF